MCEWEFKVSGWVQRFLFLLSWMFNDDELVLQVVFDGYGIVQLFGYLVSDYLCVGCLVVCFMLYVLDDCGYYLCYLSWLQLFVWVCVFIDYMIIVVCVMDLECVIGFMFMFDMMVCVLCEVVGVDCG